MPKVFNECKTHLNPKSSHRLKEPHDSVPLFFFSLFSLFSLYSYHNDLLSLPKTQPNHSCLRTFAQAFPSVWHNVPETFTCPAPLPFPSFEKQLNHPFLGGICPDNFHIMGTLTHYPVLFSLHHLSLINTLLAYLDVFVCP